MATSATRIAAEARPRAGKGPARATRRAGKVPAVVYGGKTPPSLIALDPREVTRELHRGGWQSRLYEIETGGETTRALIREVQFHPVSDRPWHVDFQRLAPGERIRVSVSVSFPSDGTSPGLKKGGVLNVVRHEVEVYADPENIPSSFVADLSLLDIGDNVRWTDLKGTEGTKPVITDRDFVICTLAPPTKAAEPVAAEGAAPAAAAAPAAKGKAAPAKPAAAPAAKAPAPKAPVKGKK